MPRAKRPLTDVDPNASNRSARVDERNQKIKGGLTSKRQTGKDKVESTTTLPRRSARRQCQSAVKEEPDVIISKKRPRDAVAPKPPNPRDTSGVKSEDLPQEDIESRKKQRRDTFMPKATVSGKSSSTPSTRVVANEAQTTKSVNRAQKEHVESAEWLDLNPAKRDDTFTRKEEIDYRTKDNSKLRLFLSERGLSQSGCREEMITRLENSSIDYESLPSGVLSEMLKSRGARMATTGPKDLKIERLRINDQQDRHTGCDKESMLYGMLFAFDSILEDQLVKHEKAWDSNSNPYSSLKPQQLSALLKKRNLSTSGSNTILIKRLQKNDRVTVDKRLKEVRTKHDSLKSELESRVGHPVRPRDVDFSEDKFQALDTQAQMAHQRKSPVPMCDYDWKDSYWAGRTERELREICRRREMPGAGTKAAMIKWLETGHLDYEDLYAFSLEGVCIERGLRFKSGARKDVLVKILRDADEDED